MAGYEIVFHAEQCVGCQACVTACMAQNDIDPKQGEKMLCRIREQEILKDESQKWEAKLQGNAGEQLLLVWSRETCRHCQEPACANVCPGGGFRKEEETGFVLYDKNRCVSCGQCILACEVGAISFDRNRKVQKCDGCYERVRSGRKPACVEVCAWNALELAEKI